MNTGYGRTYGGLETVRARFGEERVAAVFLEAAAKDKAQAAALVNDRMLRFRTLFLLIPQIKEKRIYSELNARNLTALTLCAKTLADEELQQGTGGLDVQSDEMTQNVLKWMLKTGVADDGADNAFAKTLDGAAALIADRYHDAGVLPLLVDLIFRRSREGLYVHDIAWALFHTEDPHALRLAAGYLRSNHAQDYELACVLLHLAPLSPEQRALGRQKQYEEYIAWLNENLDYLYATDESFQQKSDPEPFTVDVAAKYLARPTLLRREAVQVMSVRRDQELPREFLSLGDNEKDRLAHYSNRLYRKNRMRWDAFMKLAVAQQLKEADANAQTGGAV
ncbi:MAG: hypothetical protein ACERKO_12845 [Acetanaerobacterium sp.]